MATLEGLLENIKDAIEAAEDIVEEQSGPLVDPDKSNVATKLTDAETDISTILDPNESPSLDPTDAGDEISVTLTTLPEYADKTEEWAQEAHIEAGNISPDHDSSTRRRCGRPSADQRG